MSLTIKENGSDFELAPAGTHVARCFMVVDLGAQKTAYNGQEKHTPKILLGWELPNELDAQGKPHIVYARYSAFLSRKATLRGVLEAWRGRPFTEEELLGFHLGKVLNTCCMLNIIHSDRNNRTYANVSSVMAIPKGLPVPEAVYESVFFDLDHYNSEVFFSLSEGLQNIISQSPEWLAVNNIPAADADNGSDIPEDVDIPF